MTTAAIQTAWCDLIAATLADAGVTHVVVSPGSRSTPLALAIAREARLVRRVVVDERGAGFLALGAARASGRPVALVCTSGTAVAHYAPAVIEAAMAGIPLVVVSADRPPELHGAGASQTIDQHALYGTFTRRFADLGPPDGAPVALAAVRRQLAQAVVTARGPAPGPVQVNVPLRKPLEPAAPLTAAEHAAVAAVARLRRQPLPATAPAQLRVTDTAVADAAARIDGAARGVIVATATAPGRAIDRAAIVALATRTGYPLVVEAGSQLRFAPPAGVTAIEHASLLAASSLAPSLAPTLVVQIGPEPVAMAWPRLAAAAERIVIADHGWPDGDSTAAQVLVGDVSDTVARLATAVTPRAATEWIATWRSADAHAGAAMRAARAWPGPWSETDVIARVVAALDDEHHLVIGNSLAIRVIDEAATTRAMLAVSTQRGAAGIDGLIAGAAGAAWATGRPTTLLVGDVAFAHDVGSLALVDGLPVTVVVLDNRGGHIFDDLPLAAAGVDPELYRELWLTPTAIDPVAVAAGFGVAARGVRNPDDLPRTASAGPRLLHALVAPEGARATRARALAILTAPAADPGAVRDGAVP